MEEYNKLQNRAAAIIPQMNKAFEKAQELENDAEHSTGVKHYKLMERSKKWRKREQNYWEEFTTIVRKLTEEQYYNIKNVEDLCLTYEHAKE